MTDRVEAAVAELADALREEFRAETPAAPEPPRLYSVAEAGKLLGVSRAVAYRYITSGQLRSRKIGRRRLVSDTALREFIDEVDAA